MRAQVDARWLIALPRVQYEMPNGKVVVLPSHAIVTPKGGMTGEAFEDWLDRCIYPMFPDLAPEWEYDESGNVVAGPVVLKLDGGPGRLGPASRGWRLRAARRGLLIFPGLQNATSVNQEMDDLYGVFQQSCGDVTDEIVAERITARALEDNAPEKDRIPEKDRTKVALTNCDLGRIVCGRDSDPIELRPFERSFTPERVGASWLKIGAAPLTRAGLAHPKVRHEPIEGDPLLGDLMTLAERHAKNIAALKAKGVHTDVFEVSLPRRAIIERPTGDVAQLQQLIESGVSHSAIWHTCGPCGARALNSDVVLAAEGARIVAEKDAAAAAQAKQQSSLALLRDQVVAIETQREIDDKSYEDLTAAERGMIIKCLFQLKGLAGFSKIKGKTAEVAYLDDYDDDVIDVLNGPLPATGPTATAGDGGAASATTAAGAGSAAAAGQQRGASLAAAGATANHHRPTEDIDRDLARALDERKKIDERVGALMAERRAAVRAG